jgi:cell shape-determining protein MreD
MMERFLTPASALLRRVIIYGILLFFLIIIQTSLPFIPMFRQAVPGLVLVAAAAIGFFDSEYAGAIAGMLAGAALDSLGGVSLSLMPIAGFAAGYFCGTASGKKLPRELPAFSVCLAAVSGANLFVTLVCAYAANSELRPVQLIIHTLIPEFFYTLLFGIPVVLLSFLCTKLTGKTKRDRQASADTRL